MRRIDLFFLLLAWSFLARCTCVQADPDAAIATDTVAATRHTASKARHLDAEEGAVIISQPDKRLSSIKGIDPHAGDGELVQLGALEGTISAKYAASTTSSISSSDKPASSGAGSEVRASQAPRPHPPHVPRRHSQSLVAALES